MAPPSRLTTFSSRTSSLPSAASSTPNESTTVSRMRRRVSSPGPGGGALQRVGHRAAPEGRRSGCARRARRSSKRQRHRGPAGRASASSRSTASWRSSSSSKPSWRRSAIPPSTSRITGSQARPTGVASRRSVDPVSRGGRLSTSAMVPHPTTRVAAHEAGGLPGRHARGRSSAEPERRRRHAAPAARHRRRAVAQLHPVHALGRAVQADVAQLHAARGERAARADGHRPLPASLSST